MKKMKKLILSLAIIISGSINILAQEKPVAVENGAKIEFNKEVHDYGTIKNGADGTCIFEIKNTGSEALIISNAKGSCGCTVPSWPKEPIAPGATSQLKVKYDTKRPGSINKSVTVFSNAVNEPTKVVRIKGSVLPKPASGVPANNAGPANN
jgi:archaellum component FlaG (FlaF/FlaG flagellin family)